MDGARDEDATHESLCFEASSDIHAIAIEIVFLCDQIPQMDSDAEHHAVEFALVPVHVRDRLLKLDRRTERFHRAGELDQHSVAGRFDDPASMRGNRGVDKVLSERLEPAQRAFLINAHEAAVPSDIRRQHRCQSPLCALGGHGKPPTTIKK